MRALRRAARDAPPTAGLPLLAADLFGRDSDLEGAIAGFLGVPEVQLECSGTAALIVILTALRRMSLRDTVVVPAYTCPLVALAIAQCGLKMSVCDLEQDSLDMDERHLRRLCNERTLAVMPTHLGGRVADVATALLCARAVGAWTIEDAAQALGARVGGSSVGLQGDIGFFSLAVGKGLTIFEGGVLISRDPSIREVLRDVSQAIVPRSWRWELRRCVELLGYAALYRPRGLRLAYGIPLRRALARHDWVAAAGDDFAERVPLHVPGAWRRSVGVRALRRLPAFLAAARGRALHRRTRLAAVQGLQVLGDACGVGVWPVLMVLLPDAAARDAALQALWGGGYGVSLPFVHTLPDYEYLSGIVPHAGPHELPHARNLAARMLAVSNSPWLADSDFESVLGILIEACGRNGVSHAA
jgi:dTDP-4-amino-4,6-dideoxygalactose transaminase